MKIHQLDRPVLSAALFLIFSIFFVSSVFLIGTNIAHATVGGPTLVYDFTYNPADESVYYIRNSQNGRGCPPELLKLSLVTGTSQVAFSCDEGEKLLVPANDYNSSPVNTKITSLTNGFKPLTPIHLEKNDLSVKMRFVNYENVAPDVNEIVKANFFATISQAGKKLVEFPVVGCNETQPFTFAGYAIPGFEKKIVLLLSAKGDCWEGGYIYESLHVVGGVTVLDRTSVVDFDKVNAPLIAANGTLEVTTADKDIASAATTTNTTANTPPKNTRSAIELALLLVGAVVIGLVAGVALGKIKK
ncbi:MAG: hypothetical protein WCO79_02425 [bacterium]